jgi:hypothetical protein
MVTIVILVPGACSVSVDPILPMKSGGDVPITVKDCTVSMTRDEKYAFI